MILYLNAFSIFSIRFNVSKFRIFQKFPCFNIGNVCKELNVCMFSMFQCVSLLNVFQVLMCESFQCVNNLIFQHVSPSRNVLCFKMFQCVSVSKLFISHI